MSYKSLYFFTTFAIMHSISYSMEPVDQLYEDTYCSTISQEKESWVSLKDLVLHLGLNINTIGTTIQLNHDIAALIDIIKNHYRHCPEAIAMIASYLKTDLYKKVPVYNPAKTLFRTESGVTFILLDNEYDTLYTYDCSNNITAYNTKTQAVSAKFDSCSFYTINNENKLLQIIMSTYNPKIASNDWFTICRTTHNLLKMETPAQTPTYLRYYVFEKHNNSLGICVDYDLTNNQIDLMNFLHNGAWNDYICLKDQQSNSNVHRLTGLKYGWNPRTCIVDVKSNTIYYGDNTHRLVAFEPRNIEYKNAEYVGDLLTWATAIELTKNLPDQTTAKQ